MWKFLQYIYEHHQIKLALNYSYINNILRLNYHLWLNKQCLAYIVKLHAVCNFAKIE